MTILNQAINKQSDSSLRLIVHIGAGKTGTTSIQNALQSQQNSLRDLGGWYLGLMLEHAPVQHYPWQKAHAIEELMSLSEDDITTQLTYVLTASADIIFNSGCKTAILSNESFFERPKAHSAIIRVFEFLVTKGWEVDVIVYVRRHDTWLKSAYIQWGLKHKTYRGSLLPFSEWIKQFNFVLMDSLRHWLNAKGCKCIVRNFDAATDVVEDFCLTARIPLNNTVKIKDNQAPSSEELLLRSLFNNQIQGVALPGEFNRLMDVAKLDFSHSATTFLSNYLPTAQDLMKVIDDCADDRAKINSILCESGQQPLYTSTLKTNPVEVDLAKLTAIMFEILANQARKIELLESKISKLNMSSD